MQVIIGCLVIGAIVLIGSFFKAFQISGRENDDQQQLEFIWELQKKEQSCLVHNKNTQNCRGASSKLQREFPQ